MTSEDFVKAGYVGGLFGYEGALRFVGEEAVLSRLREEIRLLYFMENGMYVPRFIESWDADHDLVLFDRFPSREEARTLADQDVYLRKRDLTLPAAGDESSDYVWNILTGFRIRDLETDTLVGTIESVEEYPGGWMAEVQSGPDSTPKLIPLAEPLINRIDEKNQILFMTLPEGLMEI